MTDAASTLARIRRWLMLLLATGLIGTEIELLLLNHYEEPWQLVPIAVIALACVLLAWHAVAGGPTSVKAIQAVMSLMVVCGFIGVVLHYRGNLEFQLEIDASQTRWELFKKVIRAKAPPALAPGIMAQLGLLGLASTYRHPSSSIRRSEPT